MPNMDRTGPDGKGSRTGRGMGRCGGGADRREERGTAPRQGEGRGRNGGGGRGGGRKSS